MSDDLFPLPLSPFEYYYWCDDRPDYPTTFPIELVFTPGLERRLFERALEIVILRHPLLMSLVADDDRRGPCWIGGEQLASVDWAGQDAPISHSEGERIDLRRTPGLRVWAREGPDSTRLLFQFHHACCDGIGALRFIEELLIAYARECGGQASDVPLAPLEPARLRNRAALDVPSPSLWTVMRAWWVGTRIWTKFAWQSPVPLAVSRKESVPFAAADCYSPPLRENQDGPQANAPQGTKLPLLGFASRSLDPELTARLRRTANKTGCTINDLFLCGLFLAARNWNAEHGQSEGLLRINMPVSIRDRGDKQMPAANSLTFAFLNRRARDCDASQKLLESIRRETEAIKRFRLGLYFVGGLGTLHKVPGLIPWFLHRPKCRATVVLSYVGRVFPRIPLPRRQGKIVCGNAVLQSVGGVPPIRPLTRAAIIVSHYAGCTQIHLRCDPHCFDCETQEEFLAEYIEHLSDMSCSLYP